MNYREKLADPRWQKKRLEIFQRANWKCDACDDTKIELHVHHLVYSNCQPWDEPSENLECLCADCHDTREDFNRFWGGRSKISTRFVLGFIGLFWPAFDGSTDVGLNCKTVGQLRNECLKFHEKADTRLLSPSVRTDG